MNPAPKSGFTLIELLVVISIIAVLSVIALVVYTGVQQKARDAKRRIDIESLAKAMEQYKAINGSYLACNCWSSHDGVQNASKDWGGAGDTGGANPLYQQGYIQSLPKDPLNIDSNCLSASSDTCHLYHICSKTDGFFVGVNLENGTDMGDAPSISTDASGCNVATRLGGLHRFWIRSQQ